MIISGTLKVEEIKKATRLWVLVARQQIFLIGLLDKIEGCKTFNQHR